ncbi:MAG: alpha/beta fold hydrolase [Acidimicrobiia bacterium]|nr:alpha/beta fold hydrolase [Acidimicrobiia bacterium]
MADVFRFNDCEIDLRNFELRRSDQAVAIEPQVFDVLALLIAHAGEVVTKEDILDSVWGSRFVSESALTSRIKLARQAVGDDGRRQHTIKTLHGRGYRFVADVFSPETAETPSTAAEPKARERASRFEIETRYARHNGRATAYQVVGDGPTDILFVNGFVSHLELQWEIPGFCDFFERLSELGRLIVYDRLGTGLSDRLAPGEVATVEDRVAEAVAVLDAVGATDVDVIGISEGGAMSVLLAAQHPQRVRSMSLINSFVNDDHQDPATNQWFLDWMEQNWGRGSVYTKILAPSWDRNPTMRQLCARYERHAATPGAARRIIENTIAHTDAAALLPDVNVPTCVVHRVGDQLVPLAAGEYIADHIRDARFVRLEGDDHLAFAGDRDALLAPIEELITGIPGHAPEHERSLRALVFADIVDSTSMAVEMGDQRWSDLLVRFHDRARDTAERLGGRVVKTIGDGVLFELSGPARAVRSALDLQQAIAPLGLQLRSGVHFAAVETIGDDLAGIGVHICARVASLAEPGEVWVSRTVFDLVAGSGLEFSSRGVHELRGASQTWELFAAT